MSARVARLRARSARQIARQWIAVALCATVSSLARADDLEAPDPAAAALFQSGREQIEQGDWEGGCAKLAQSLARSANASTQLNLARCAEHAGKIVRAHV